MKSIAELFYKALERDLPDALAAKSGGTYVLYSHREVQARVERLVLALERRGLAAGDRIAILSENRPEWAMADYACAILGIVTAPVYPTLNPVSTEYILRHSGARVVFCSTAAQLAKVAEVWHRLPLLEAAVLMEGVPEPFPGRAVLAWEELQAEGAAREADRPRVRALAAERDPGQLLTLIYTSGTTGEPKGAMLTHGNLVSNILAALEVLQIGPGRRCLSFLPLSHIFERMGGHYTMFHCGVSIYYVDNLENLPAAFLEVRPQVLMAVPRVYEKVYARIRETVSASSPVRRRIFALALEAGRRMAAHRYRGSRPGPVLALLYGLADRIVFAKVRERLGGRLELSASGGAPLAPQVMEFFWAAGVPIFEGYGLSETAPILTLTRRNEVRPGYVGRPLLETWRGAPFLKLAEDGEILCQGPNVTMGYWDDPFATSQAFDADGYFRTGDIGTLDELGRLRITDRKKELLVTSGGKNVAPQPLERRLAMDKYIAQAVVVGDRRNFLAAVVVANMANLRRWAEKAGIPYASDAELAARPEAVAKVMARIERINEGLSKYERIRRIVLTHEEMTLESGLLTPSLKVKRKAVMERYGERIEALYEGSS
ncbi:AMP-dependent synthetase/ligase [Mesoterricola sediminis]|uniref:AMP-dependent synthetase n=1 Tax=Mesoterricola sediminis TaxID=2927980 RepID=A0AA48KF43_9BACT|nr:long-chain fatty acid--CoA ligase [Mesoterricola sediminis]BDU76073.1 AMP-dependent synthetase [Mesoterricola sediminis]